MGTALDRFFGGPVLSPRSLLEDFFDTGLFGTVVDTRNYKNMLPQATINQDNDGATLEIGLPGFAPEDVDVFIEDRALYINATHKGQDSEDGNGDSVWQRSYKRSMTLPDGVDEEGVAASLENGLLNIKLPRTTEEQKEANRRRIEIKQSAPEIEGKSADSSAENEDKDAEQ